MTKWVVLRYKFDEDTRAWLFDSCMTFKSDEELLAYFRSQTRHARDYRHEVTAIQTESVGRG